MKAEESGRRETGTEQSLPELPVEGDSTAVPDSSPTPGHLKKFRARASSLQARFLRPLHCAHARIPYVRSIPLPAFLIILLLVVVNLLVWLISALVVISLRPPLISTCALAYTLGLRHALDADHISAIDLMTRRLVASGQRPVTVGTFFSLGHSTIVIITSIVVAATAAGISHKFDGISHVGSIIGSAVSSAFLIFLGLINAYILYKLIQELRRVIRLSQSDASLENFKIEGSGPIFRLLRVLFKLIDRPWKMYPVGVVFGLGFDTSSEIAILGISSIQGAKGTSIWLILTLPVLFTAGMCLVDTIDGALMLALYIKPVELAGMDDKKPPAPLNSTYSAPLDAERGHQASDDPLIESDDTARTDNPPAAANDRAKDPLTFLYYSTVLTSLTVFVAMVIGTIQLLTLILNVTHGTGRFWDGVATAGTYWEEIGASICGSFILVGLISVLCYRPWRRWVERRREALGVGVRVEERGEAGGEGKGAPVERESKGSDELQSEHIAIEDGKEKEGQLGLERVATASIDVIDAKTFGS